MKIRNKIKNLNKRIAVVPTMVFLKSQEILASGITEESIKSAGKEGIETIFLVIAGAFFALGIGLMIFGGYNISLMLGDGAQGNNQQKAIGGLGGGIAAIIVGLLVLTKFKEIVLKGMGL